MVSIPLEPIMGRTRSRVRKATAHIQFSYALPGIRCGTTKEGQRQEIGVHRVARGIKGFANLLSQIRIRLDWLRQPEHNEAILRVQMKGAHAEPGIEPEQRQAGPEYFFPRRFDGQRADDLQNYWRLLA